MFMVCVMLGPVSVKLVKMVLSIQVKSFDLFTVSKKI